MATPYYRFDVDSFFPRQLFNAITEIRVLKPEIILSEAKARKRRMTLTQDGKLTILAGDHTGRGTLKCLNDPLRMADRHEYLGRLLRVVTHPDFDGVMATPDIIEDMLVVNYLVKNSGKPSFLDNKVIIGCMQRGGVSGVAGEIDDRFSAYSAASLKEFCLDGGKMLIRAVDDDERTLRTVDYCAQAVSELRRQGLTAFIEPLPQKVVDGRYTSNYSEESLLRWVSVCSSLGDSSSNSWLKVPYIPQVKRVAEATTLPILMLGGEARSDPTPLLEEFEISMLAGSNVRGVMVGRNVLYPGDDDPLAFALAVNRIVHDGMGWKASAELMQRDRGANFDALASWSL